MSESTSTSYSGLQPYSSESAQTASTRHSNVTEPVASKRICFYKSGDPQFNGIKMVVSNRSFKTFDALLDGLSKRVPLPFGVRNISTPRGIHQVSTLDELEDGKSYICSHKKKIKPINLERASRKPLLWQSSRPISARRRVAQLLRQNEVTPAPGDNTVVLGLSKKLVIFKNGDPEFKHTIILNKKITQHFEALLDHMTEVMQCPVTKLYTADGRRIFGMQALMLSSGPIVAAGREPFKPGNYDSKKESLPVKLPGIPRRVLPKTRNKPEARNPGQWKVSIFTSDMPSAGTTAQVYITLYGHHRCSGPTFLYGSEEDLFQSGHQDIFTINTGDIGDTYKIRIGHNNSGDSPAWHCEEVQLQNLYTNEQFYIPVHRWLAQDQEDGEICRELPVLRPGHPILPVTIYDVHVVTGDLWNAGTCANVYISIYGERGDTGSRHLLKSKKTKTFSKGQTDIFRLEAVHLGNVYKIVIGHDGLGAGNGWYLEKVIVQDHIKDTEYVFLCHRWLDQGEDDGKIVTELYTDISNFSAREELELKRKEIWGAERWKYQRGNTLQFYCKVTRRLIRLMPDGTVDAFGDKKDKYGFFDVTVKRGNIRVFTSHQIRHLALAIDKGFAAGMDNYGNLCELQLHVHPNRCVTLESVRAPGHTITFNPEGNPIDGAATGYAGLSKEFVVHVKGVFHNGAVVLLTTNWCQALYLRHDGSCSATGSHSEESYWKVHKISSAVCMFESVRIPRMFLRIKDTYCDGTGTGDQYCHFKIEKNLENGSISLESIRNRGMYVGFLTDGGTKPLVHTGERNILVYPQVIKFGREKPTGTSATASQEKEVTNNYEQDPEKPQKPVARSPSDSPPRSKREIKTAPAPSDGDWKVLVLTGNTGTLAAVTLWVYGDKGVSGPIKLGEDDRETVFLAQQEDEFKVKLKNIGMIYKIRIGHDGSSEQPEWKLQRVTLLNMKSKKMMIFEVNRWLSRNRSDGDIVCEVPLSKNGKAVYPVVRYQVYVNTGDLEHAETNSPVYICIHGERGDSGLRLLHKSDVPVKFQRGQVDMFEVGAVSLGKLRKVLLLCESSSTSQSWYCEKVIIRDPGKGSEYIFSCERWLPFMSKGIMHSEIELQVQDMQINDHANAQEKINEGDWKVTVVTGNFENSGTDATVFLYAYGKKQESGAIILGSGKEQLFNSNSVDTFKVKLKHLGELYKIRIGHDNIGENPGWYLEEVRLQDMALDAEFCLAVNRWLHEEKDDGDTWREIVVPRPKKELLTVLNYEIHVYTGSKPGSNTQSNVYINLFGTRGDSGNRKLRRSKNHKAKFQQGQIDVFNIEAVSLGDLKKVVIGHDGIDADNGWFLDKVEVKTRENGNGKTVVFPCNSWLDKYQGDGKTERELLPKRNNDSLQSSVEGGQWKLMVKTAKDSPEPGESRISIAIYGSNGKTGNQLLSPPKADSVCFLPGAAEEFLVNTSDVGKVYKVRVTCDNIPAFKGWHLKSLFIKEEETNQEIRCTCNWWFSTSPEKVEMIKEFPAEIKGKQPLPVNKYYVSVHTGDQWGAETFANVYLTIYGERGDTGPRKLEQPLTSGKPFQRNKVDSFIVEAVSLSQLQKIVVGHDGEGYGSGMFLKMVTVRESQSAIHECVFPFWNWLDSHIEACQTVGKLMTIGKRQVSSPRPSQMSKQSPGIWILDLSGSAMDEETGPVQLSLILYGNLGRKSLLVDISTGSAQIEDELREVGVINKVQITSGANTLLRQQWRLDNLHMRHTGSQQEMWLNFNCWFKPDEESCVELPALYAGQDPVPVIVYAVHVHTGSDQNAETCGEVYLSLHGERGNSGKRWLSNADTGPITFGRGKVDVFRLRAVHLGKLQKITIGFSSSKEDNWLLNKIIVKEEGYFPSAEYVFVHNEWISQRSKDFTETVIPVTEENDTSEIVKQFDIVSKGEWYMWLESSLPEEAPDIDVILFGRYGKSPAQKVTSLENEPFLLHAEGIGEITKVSFVRLDSHLKRGLKLHKLRLKDLDTKEELGFQTAERWLFGEDGSETVTELAAVRPGRAPLNGNYANKQE